MTQHTPPSTLIDDLHRVTVCELSLPSRIRYVGFLLAAAAMTVIVTALLVTEPDLPRRTSIALAVLAVMGVSWMCFAGWVLTTKRILLGRHRVVASRLAVGFSSVFVIGATLVGYATQQTSALAAAGLGLLMLAVAGWMLIRATHRFQQLTRRRDELERQLGRSGR